MSYPKEFFAIQIEFAEKVAAVTGKSLGDTLLEYTSLYKRFGIENWNFNKDEAVWKKFLEELYASEDRAETAYIFQAVQDIEKITEEFFGCFRYEYREDMKDIRLHFSTHGKSGMLKKENVAERMKELKMLFADVTERYPTAKTVSGISWLFSIDACRRLFPQEFLESAQTIDWYRSMAVWGQFIDSSKNSKTDLGEKFRHCFQRKTNLEDLLQCFPYKVLSVSAPIENFYTFYKIYAPSCT